MKLPDHHRWPFSMASGMSYGAGAALMVLGPAWGGPMLAIGAILLATGFLIEKIPSRRR